MTFAGWRRVYELSPTAAIVTVVVLLAGLAGYIVGRFGIAITRASASPLTWGRDQPICT